MSVRLILARQHVRKERTLPGGGRVLKAPCGWTPHCGDFNGPDYIPGFKLESLPKCS